MLIAVTEFNNHLMSNSKRLQFNTVAPLIPQIHSKETELHNRTCSQVLILLLHLEAKPPNPSAFNAGLPKVNQ